MYRTEQNVFRNFFTLSAYLEHLNSFFVRLRAFALDVIWAFWGRYRGVVMFDSVPTPSAQVKRYPPGQASVQVFLTERDEEQGKAEYKANGISPGPIYIVRVI